MENISLSILGHLSAWKDWLLYAIIVTVIWSLIARVIGNRALFILTMLPGTFLHELSHLIFGILTNAKPNSFSIIPNRMKLGSVSFTNITWYNAIPTALAPLLGLVFVSVTAIHSLPVSIHNITAINLLVLLVLSPVAYACWPSSVDWKLSLRGWPVYAGGVAYLLHVAG
jgi:hypothetical protein